ncbi:hypothetical protein WAI453_009440 [Rhynchosporium graminicola]
MSSSNCSTYLTSSTRCDEASSYWMTELFTTVVSSWHCKSQHSHSTTFAYIRTKDLNRGSGTYLYSVLRHAIRAHPSPPRLTTTQRQQQTLLPYTASTNNTQTSFFHASMTLKSKEEELAVLNLSSWHAVDGSPFRVQFDAIALHQI